MKAMACLLVLLLDTVVTLSALDEAVRRCIIYDIDFEQCKYVQFVQCTS